MPNAIINKDAESRTIKSGEFQNTGLSKQPFMRRSAAMVKNYSTWEATQKDIATLVYPTKGFFNTPTPNQGSKIDHKTLIDEEATLCADAFKSGMTSGFTSPTRPWFELFLEDEGLMEIAEVRYWLQMVRDKMLDIYQRSNTYTALTSMYLELAVFSTACAHIEEDYDNIIHIHLYTAGEYYLATDNTGRVNAFFRRFWMSADQMVKKFGEGNISPKVQQAYTGNRPDQQFLVNHLIEENDDRIPYLKDYNNMPYRSVYWEDGTVDDSYLRIGGYEEFPLLSPRWDTRTMSDAYGSGGPGWKALGAVKELQKKIKIEIIGLEKQTNPPLQRDASVVGEVNTLPGGITTFSAQLPNAGVKPTYEVALNLKDLDASLQNTRQKIRRFFYTDLFLMMIQAEREGRQITATEIMEKQSEKLSILGPLLERWQGDDFIKSLIERTFNIGMRNNAFPPAPAQIRGRELKIRYTSILAQAQRMQGIIAIDQWVESVLAMAEAFPEIKDNINFDEYAKEKATMLGVPPKIANSPEAIAELRKMRQKALQEADAQKKALILAQAGKDAAGAIKSLGDSPLGTNSALDSTLDAIRGASPQ